MNLKNNHFKILYSFPRVHKCIPSFLTHLFCISSIIRDCPFDFFKVEWSNFHIFDELCGCKDIGTQVEHMDVNDYDKEDGTTLHQCLKLSQRYHHKERQSINIKLTEGKGEEVNAPSWACFMFILVREINSSRGPQSA